MSHPARYLVVVDVMRRLERKLESVLERAAGPVFGEKSHVSELAGSVVRVLDLSVDDAGLVPNKVLVPARVPTASIAELEAAITEAILERGWRIEGPVEVVPSDVRTVTVTVDRGPVPPWAYLVGDERVAVTVNRAVIGRSRTCDVVVDHPSVSRRHAMLWTRDGHALCVDLGSSNGSTVDGAPVGATPVEVGSGSTVAFGSARFRFEWSTDA